MKLSDIDRIEQLFEQLPLHDCLDPVLHYYSLKRPESVTLNEACSRIRLVHKDQTIVVMLATDDPNDPAEVVISTRGNSLAVNHCRGMESQTVFTYEQLLGLVGLP